MNRRTFQQLAVIRIREAETLLKGERPGTYYLTGYAVECALKACIAKQTTEFDFPDKELARRCFTHDLTVLLQVAGLDLAKKEMEAGSQRFAENWLVAKDWSESSRYEELTESEAKKLFNAVNDRTDGVLTWLKTQ